MDDGPVLTRRGSAPPRLSTVDALMREAKPRSQRRALKLLVGSVFISAVMCTAGGCAVVALEMGGLHLAWAIPAALVLSVATTALAVYCHPLGWRALVVLSRAALAYRVYNAVDSEERRRKKPYEVPGSQKPPPAGSKVAPPPEYEGVPQELEDEIQRKWDEAHAVNAQRLLVTARRCRGMWIKFCQMLSTRADVMPPVYIRTLRECQDSLPPPDFSVTAKALRDSFGGIGSGDSLPPCFESLDKDPLAVASIGAVYKGRLKADGKDVVVKVLHKGIAEKIGIDLDIIRWLMEKVAGRKPQWDFRWAIDEWITEVWQEVDLRVEAANLRDVSAGVLSLNEMQPPFKPPCKIEFPSIVPSFVTRQALVMEFVEGRTMGAVVRGADDGLDRKMLAHTVVHCQCYQIYVMGAFNGDPHPGNFLVRADDSLPGGGALVPLDFGLTKRPPRSFKIAACDTITAAIEKDGAAIEDAFTRIGFVWKEGLREMLTIMVRLKFDPRHSKEKREEMNADLSDDMKQRREELRKQGQSPVESWPETFVFYDRSLTLMRNLVGSLGLQENLLPVVEPFARCGQLGSPEAAVEAIEKRRGAPAAAEGPTEFETMLQTFKPGILNIITDKVKEMTDAQKQAFARRFLSLDAVPGYVKAVNISPEFVEFAHGEAEGAELDRIVFTFPKTMQTMQDLKEFGAELKAQAEREGVGQADGSPAAPLPGSLN